ncbi:MAG: protein kinase [Verrucomicrobiaceae bacterium]|nr:protein kinase [Verrucomicrobiaceae bacterium]
MSLEPIKDYEYGELLGEGATGQVFAGKRGDQDVAIKVLKRLAINRKLIGYSLSRLQRLPTHPNLVKTYGFAMDGRPVYIATSLHAHEANGKVSGFSLGSQCGGMDPDLAWAIVRQIAEGLGHLHKHGVVHCSVNPGNVMVANPDTSEIKLTDYAQGWLAEVTHIDFSESFLYAPPEQLRKPQEMFEGQSQRWDVYAFGATAYRLLYKQFPRGQRWISQMRKGAVAFHPMALADVISQQPEIQWPGTRDGFEDQRQRLLEKCLMLDPSDRYSDMREVLDHFARIDRDEKLSIERKDSQERERVLTETSIEARKRMGLFRKAAIGLLGCLIVSVLLNVTSEARLTKRRQEISNLEERITSEVGEAQGNAMEAKLEAERFKSNLTYSQETADAFLEFLLNARSPSSPGYQSIDGYLVSASQHYERVLRATEGDSDLVVERLRAQLGLARIEAQLGQQQSVTSKLGSLVGEIQTLPENLKQLNQVQETLAAALLETGKSKMAAGMLTGALQSLQESVKVYNRLATSDGKNMDLKRKFGRSLFLYGQQLSRAGDLIKALKSQQSSMQVLESLAQSSAAREEDEYYLALCQYEVGLIKVWEGKGIEAFEAFQLASQGYSRLMSQKPQVPEYRFQLAKCLYYLGELSFQVKGDQEEAALARNSMYELLKLLLEKDEANQDYQFYLALVFADMAEMKRDAGEREEANKLLVESLAILTELHKSKPKDSDVTLQLAMITVREGDFLLDARKASDALGKMKAAEALFQEIDDSGFQAGVPDHVYHLRRASMMSGYGHALEAAGNADEAAAAFRKAQAILAGIAAKRPDDGRILNAIEAIESRVPSESMKEPESTAGS